MVESLSVHPLRVAVPPSHAALVRAELLLLSMGELFYFGPALQADFFVEGRVSATGGFDCVDRIPGNRGNGFISQSLTPQFQNLTCFF